MTDVIGRFKDVGPNRLIVTKTDEADGLGKLVTVLERTGMPVSYVTTGQDIPDDIEVADATRVAAMVWGDKP
jgi:flagellar biosynthesis protein FlhF